jgi:hypothetical protein
MIWPKQLWYSNGGICYTSWGKCWACYLVFGDECDADDGNLLIGYDHSYR